MIAGIMQIDERPSNEGGVCGSELGPNKVKAGVRV